MQNNRIHGLVAGLLVPVALALVTGVSLIRANITVNGGTGVDATFRF